MPSAQRTDESRGTMIVESSSSSAIAPAWTGPAPPAATSGSSRGSYPRWIETFFVPAAMFRSITSAIAAAASTAPRPSGPAMRRSTASRARSGESCIRPPRK